jgi:serine palmitoyltransferase
MEAAPLYVLVCTYLNYFVLILFGHLRDILGKLFKPQAYTHLKTNQVRHLKNILKTHHFLYTK